MESLGCGSKKVLSKSRRLGFRLPCTKMSRHTLQNLSQTLKWVGTLKDREREDEKVLSIAYLGSGSRRVFIVSRMESLLC